MAPRNHADCVASYCDAILSGEIIAGRYVVAQFGLTPKSKRGRAAGAGWFLGMGCEGGADLACDFFFLLRNVHRPEVIGEAPVIEFSVHSALQPIYGNPPSPF